MDNLPNDLADVLKILHEWQPMHTDGHLVSIPGNVPLLNLRLSLPHDINAFPFSKYASRHIRDHRLGITQEPLRLPFLPKHSAQDNKDSLDIFTLILSYMFERRMNEDRRLIIADYIIQKGLSRESLRDEIYIQLINQTIGKASSSSDAAWLLLASCLSTFAPSTVLAKHLLKYVSDDGVDGFDAVCQQKLLQCFGLEPELSRSYPPCLLEWTTNKNKAAMALYASFSDGEQGVCQVESWTTGEQMAINLFRSRHLTDDLQGWSVQLRDDVDTYECAGYDFVLDLISEMELPPSFPCLTAYFLTMTDISRPASTNRRHWPDEPHNAEQLRLMPLEVDELSDQPVADLPSPVPIPQTPRPPSPSPASPPKRISFVEEPPKQPQHNSYRKTEGAMSQGSALNKRKDRVPDELSKTSVLNSRYAKGHTGADTSKTPQPVRPNPAPQQPPRQQQPQKVAPPPVVADDPPARRRSRPPPAQQQQQQQAPQKPAAEEDMSAWLDSVFREALSGGGPGQGLANPQAVSRNMKGGEDNLQAQYGLVGGVNGVYGLNAFGIQAAPGAPAMGQQAANAPSVYPSAMMGHQPSALSQLSTGIPTVITQATMPPALPVVVDPAVQLMQQQQFIQQQQHQQQQQLQQQQQQQQQLLQHLRLQHQQQIQMHQHAADLQVQLQTKELEKQVLQSTIHAEMLKQQLQHLQDSQQPQPQKQQQHQQPQTPQLQHQQQHQQTSQHQQQLQQLQQSHQQQQQQLQQLQQRPQSNSSVSVAMRHSGATDDHPRPLRPVSGSYIHPAAPEPTLNRQRVPGEVDESRPGGVQTLKRSYLTKNASFSEPRPLPLPAAATAAAAAPKQVTVVVAHNKGRPVRFVDQEKEESSDEEEEAAPAPLRPPSPPIVKKETKAAVVPALKKQPVVNQTKSVPAAQVIKPAAAVIVTKTIVTKPVVNSAPETNGEVDEGPRKAPGKIGIKWPPEPEKTEKQAIPVNRLVIMETKEEKMAIRRGQSSEEVQQKMNSRIRSSQQAAEREDSPPPPPPARRPPPPLAATKSSEVQMEEAGTQVQTWNKIDMATKKKELETMLKGVQWGTQNKKDSPVAPQPERQPPPVAHHESQSAYDLSRLDNIRTVLHAQCAGPFYAYKNVPWSLEIRKEVFSPSENLNNPTLVNLVFAQIVTDVLSGDSIRITQDDKRKMRKVLDTHGINLRNIGTGHSTQVKKSVIKAAKELPIFFARIFPVNGGSKQSRVQMVAVSHSGVRLLARHKDVFEDYIIVFEQIKFSDVIDVHVPRSSTILMRLTGRNVVLYTKYATQLCNMLTSYRQEHSEIIPKIRINDNDDDDD